MHIYNILGMLSAVNCSKSFVEGEVTIQTNANLAIMDSVLQTLEASGGRHIIPNSADTLLNVKVLWWTEMTRIISRDLCSNRISDLY